MIDWLQGAVDVHVHASPSIYPRLLDDDQLVAQAQAAGMRGLLLKSHEGSTVERAQMAQKRVSRLAVRGGVVLNHFVGGFNPYAVEMALALGGVMVWMPTIHCANHIRHFGMAGFKGQTPLVRTKAVPPLSVLDEKGRLLDSVRQVLEVMAGRPAALSCGHLSMPEIAALFAEAKRLKIERRVLTHADASLMHCTLEFQLEMAREGHFIERSFLSAIHPGDPFPVARTAAEVKRIGVERVVLETDLGQASNMAPTAGLASYCQQLHEAGLSEADVRRVAGENPAFVLNLPAQ